MMSPESVYFAEQEFNRFEEIMNTKTYLTKEEYDFCFAYDKVWLKWVETVQQRKEAEQALKRQRR